MTKLKKLFSILIILFLAINGISAQDLGLRADPYEIIAGWTYEDVQREYGEGDKIIDTMSGKAYIAGFKYHQTWFNKPCELEFYFTDVNVSRFLLRFIHPNNAILEKEDEKRKENYRQSQLVTDKEKDSLLLERLKDDSRMFDSVAYLKELFYRWDLLEKDSLRSDSLIRSISEIIGKPLKEGRTSHTEKESRYQATWIQNGYSCSLKDYRQFTEVNFGVSPAPGAAIAEFYLDPGIKLIEKFVMNIKGEKLEISLLGLPRAGRNLFYDRLFILASTQTGGLYLDELPEERNGGTNPRLEVSDLTGDNIPDVWLKVDIDPDGFCTNNFIYTMELKEPLLIFDPLDDLFFELEGEFQDDYNALIIIDGAERSILPLQKDKEDYKTIFDQKGKLLKEVKVWPGCLERIEAQAYKSKKGSQIIGYLAIHGVSKSDIIGYMQATWDYSSGGWELRSLEIWQD